MKAAAAKCAVGARRAKELTPSGLPFSVGESDALGLVNRVLPQEQLTEAAI